MTRRRGDIASSSSAPSASCAPSSSAVGKRTRSEQAAQDSTEEQEAEALAPSGPHTPLHEIAAGLADLDDAELRQLRARLTARLSASLSDEVRATVVRRRDAAEWLQVQRQLSVGEAPSAFAAAPTDRELSTAAPEQGAGDLDATARARLESATRAGGRDDEQKTYAHLAGHGARAQSDALTRQHRAIGDENATFVAELRQTAKHTAVSMLDASTHEIEEALAQYGMSGGKHRLNTAAKQYLRDPESLPQLIAEWRTLSHSPDRAESSAHGGAAQAELAHVVAELRAKQARVVMLEREEHGFTEADWMRRDDIDPSRSSQSAKAELAEAWLAAEERHPILLAFRHPKYGADADRMGGLDSAGAGMEEKVLAQVVPKLANILRTKQELGAGRLDVMRMAPVLEVAKQRMAVPPGSQRAAIVAELHREAQQTPLAEHVLSALQLGLAVLSFVPGVGAGAMAAAELVSLAIELRSQVHEYKEWRSAGGMNNTALDIARSVSQQAPQLRPLVLRLAAAGASTVALVQFGRLAIKLERARDAAAATEAADDVLRELDALGDSVGVRNLGEQVEAVGGVRGAAVYPKRTFVAKDGSARASKLAASKLASGLRDMLPKPRVAAAKLGKPTLLGEDGVATVLRVPSVGDASAEAAATEVHLEIRIRGEMTGEAVHGAESGPARFSFGAEREGKRFATIELDQHVDPLDLEFVLGHELDEIAEIVRRHPLGPLAGGLKDEMVAGVMRQGATTSKATAHDVAQAREIVAQYKQLKGLTKEAERRGETFERSMEVAGLREPSQIDAKVRLLQEAGAPEELLAAIRRVESHDTLQKHLKNMGGTKATLNEDFVHHILWPSPRGNSVFRTEGVGGGHHTEKLLAMGWPNSEYVFVEVAAKPAGKSIARHFKQYRWQNGGPIPTPGSGRFPTDKNFVSDGWTEAIHPKTTVDDPLIFMQQTEEAWERWKASRNLAPTDETRMFSSVSDDGVPITGYTQNTDNGPVVTSAFIEVSWF